MSLMELFVPVLGYEESYLISEKGKLWSNHSNRILAPLPTRDGYYRYALSKNGAKTYVFAHRLVAQAFIPNPNNYPQINHIDENKTNNSVDNLEWCDGSYNLSYGNRMQRISNSLKNHPSFSKKVICEESGAVYDSIHEAARQTGLKRQNISAACKNHRTTAGGRHWRLEEDKHWPVSTRH